MEKALFLCSFVFFLKSLLITYLITLSVEKKYIVLEKNGKSLEFWIRNLHKLTQSVNTKKNFEISYNEGQKC